MPTLALALALSPALLALTALEFGVAPNLQLVELGPDTAKLAKAFVGMDVLVATGSTSESSVKDIKKVMSAARTAGCLVKWLGLGLQKD